MYKHVQNSVLLSFQQCLLSFPMLVVTPFLVIAEITSLIVEMTVSDALFLNKKVFITPSSCCHFKNKPCYIDDKYRLRYE